MQLSRVDAQVYTVPGFEESTLLVRYVGGGIGEGPPEPKNEEDSWLLFVQEPEIGAVFFREGTLEQVAKDWKIYQKIQNLPPDGSPLKWTPEEILRREG